MQGIRPIRGDHALASVVFSISFNREIEINALRAIDDRWNSFEDDLPRRSELEGFDIDVAARLSAPQDVPRVFGRSYERYNERGEVARSLAIQGQYLRFSVNDYTRWSEVWPSVHSIIVRIWRDVCNNRLVSSVSLQIQNQFRIEEQVDSSDSRPIAQRVFERNTPHLTPHVFECTNNWHCFTGHFSDPATIQGGLRLNRIHCQVATMDNPNNRLLSIQTELEDRLSPSGRGETLDLKQRMGSLREAHKEILRNLLVREIQDQVGLNHEQYV